MYIVKSDKQLERIKEMVTVRKDLNTFEVFYHDPATGNLWKSFFPRGFKEHKGPKLLRQEPLPENLEYQLDFCLNSDDDSDAIGLGIECSVKPEMWPEIIHILDKNRKEYKRSNLNTFIKHLGILKPEASLREVEIDIRSLNLSKSRLNTLRKKAKRIKLKRFFRL